MTIRDDYNEHPTVVHTGTGEWVIYMSAHGVERRPLKLMLGTDWHAMRIDGSGTKRLATMMRITPDPANTGQALVAGTVALSLGQLLSR